MATRKRSTDSLPSTSSSPRRLRTFEVDGQSIDDSMDEESSVVNNGIRSTRRGVPVGPATLTNGLSRALPQQQPSTSTAPAPSLEAMDDDILRYIVLHDPKNSSPFSPCLCTSKPQAPVNAGEIDKSKAFCQAIDCFDGKKVGCCNQAKLVLTRASIRVPFRAYCEVHLARMRRHHCCPGCGIFCTQGEFLQCRGTVKGQVHLFHKTCQVVTVSDPNKQHCPHCGTIGDLKSVRIIMNGPVDNNTVYFLRQTPPTKSPNARMACTPPSSRIPPKEEANADPVDQTNGVEITIPDRRRTLSIGGLPFGPERKELEEILQTFINMKKSGNLASQSTARVGFKSFQTIVKNCDVEKTVQLLYQGLDPNYKFEEHENETPLHLAASHGHLVIVHLLIQGGASYNATDGRHYTALMEAAEKKHNKIVNYLVKVGASLDVKEEEDMTALHLAAKEGNYEAVEMILDTKKIDTKNFKSYINAKDKGGWTSLIWATENKHKNVVELLLSRGADGNIEDDEGNVCLHWAAYSGSVDIIGMLLDRTPDINAVNIHGDTALHIAARRDNYEAVMLLTSRDVDVSIINKHQETAPSCCPEESQSYAALQVKCELQKIATNRKEPFATVEKYLYRDIARGKEFTPIPIVNGVDDEKPPTDYTYVAENCETSPLNIDRTISSLQSCKCEDDCTSDACFCATISYRCWYDNEGKLLDIFNYFDPPLIFECNHACSCWTTCSNRVVQKGIRCKLQVFRTGSTIKGWGVRSLTFIPRGTFVCEYVGEVISDSEADRREDDSYLFDLDHKDGETLYCLDARNYGNVARFINHGCDANLTPVKVFVDHQDLSFPRMAFFANRDIFPLEELTFDYGEKFWIIKHRLFTCECASRYCKYSKESIKETLEDYRRRQHQEEQINGHSNVSK